MRPLTIIDAMSDPELFGGDFRSCAGTDSWLAWKAFLAALYGLPLPESQLAVYRTATGRQEATEPTSEAFVISGRRSGKSRIASLVAVYEAAFVDHRAHLAPGESSASASSARARPT